MSVDQYIAAVALGVSVAWVVSAVIAIAANVWLERPR